VRHTISYSYIFVLALFNIVKILSDVFVFLGMWQLCLRLDHLDPRFERTKRPSLKSRTIYESPGDLAIKVATIILFFLSIYHICLLFGLAFVWLQATDPQVVQRIAKAKNGFEISYMALQFFGTIAMYASSAVCTAGNKENYYHAYQVCRDFHLSRIPDDVVDLMSRNPFGLRSPL
jgi:hypothetical protein